MKTLTKSRSYLAVIALALTMALASSSQVWADQYHYGNYRHDGHGYWDDHHAYHHYAYWHSHHGYWGYQNGVSVFFILN